MRVKPAVGFIPPEMRPLPRVGRLLEFPIRIQSFRVNASVAVEVRGQSALGPARAGKAQHRSEGRRSQVVVTCYAIR